MLGHNLLPNTPLVTPGGRIFQQDNASLLYNLMYYMFRINMKILKWSLLFALGIHYNISKVLIKFEDARNTNLWIYVYSASFALCYCHECNFQIIQFSTIAFKICFCNRKCIDKVIGILSE